MTVPAIPVACPPANTDVEAPRKRRRRAPASGAADDCFACHKRSVKCDRRRPYCSPCLEIGSECSGYKTQLTWGVGVASRGKLRGLSLPIAKSAPVKNSPPRTFRQRANTTNKLMMQQRKEHEIEIKIECEQPMASPYTNYDFVHMNPKSPSSPVPSDWGQSDYLGPQHHEGGHGHLLRQSLSRLQPPTMRYGDDLSSSTGSLSAYSDNDYSPIASQFDDSSYLSPTAYEYGGSPEHVFSTSADSRAPTSFPDQFYLRSPSSHQSFDDQSQSSASVRHSESESDYNDDFGGEFCFIHCFHPKLMIQAHILNPQTSSTSVNGTLKSQCSSSHSHSSLRPSTTLAWVRISLLASASTSTITKRLSALSP